MVHDGGTRPFCTGSKCSWDTTNLALTAPGSFCSPHVRLATDDAIFLVLHFPPRAKLRLFQRPANKEALRLLAAVVLQELELRDCLDTLGDHAQPHTVRQRDDGLRDCFVVFVLLQAPDEALIDLDALNRQ